MFCNTKSFPKEIFESFHGCCTSGFSRMFFSKEEKLETLKKYEEELANELKGIKEEIEKLK